MFNFIKKKTPGPPEIFDINGVPIGEGDCVLAQRYDLGKCKIVLEGLHYHYQSIESGDKISYTRMVDAITGFQKVVKENG